ncbi:UNVERIFIED_CONTAM: hypothetical protein FKN15_004550 [Acipenser sinensis]
MQVLNQRYPDIRIEGENYLPLPIYRHIASFLSIFKLALIGLIILGKDPFAFFGMQAPGVWRWGQENKDLWQQGYYITSAGKFGGDYLIYPGDPLRFHAHFIAVCVPIKSESPISDFLCLARLGANVKKTILLCSPSETESEGVIYTSIQWSGMV